MASNNTIIFGATGHVASAAACFAQEQGAKVFLAMRDLNKEVPGLNPEQEKDAGFDRVYADLAKPETLRAAVNVTGAKRAFLYLILGTSFKGIAEALKSAGVEFIVFLSSSSIKGDPQSVLPSDYIGWQHAQAEIALKETFGQENYMAVRPGYFATNSFIWKNLISSGKVKIPYAEVAFDYISPRDIGRVCGSLLAGGPQIIDAKAGINVVQLYGPQSLTQREAVLKIGKVFGKELEIEEIIGDQEGAKFYVETLGFLEPVAKGIIGMLNARSENKSDTRHLEGPVYEEAISNIYKYTGKQPTSFSQWVRENEKDFRI